MSDSLRPHPAAGQVPLSTLSWSLLRFMFIESVRLTNHLILCRSLLLPSSFSSIRVFSDELALRHQGAEVRCNYNPQNQGL